MRLGLPLAVALGVAGVTCAGAAVLASPGGSHPSAQQDRVIAPGTASYFHDVAPTHQVATARSEQPSEDEVMRQPDALPSCPEGPSVHFDTPQAAMRYLASAWNRNDLAALCQVTNPNARFLLNDMHREAVNLRLRSCQWLTVGMYSCTFVHDYPARMHRQGHGRTWLEVEAADNPGWYMSNYVGCG